MNRVILIGRLVRDPEVRVTQSGLSVTRMRIAVDRARTNAAGNREADFIDIRAAIVTISGRSLRSLAASS